MTNNKDWNRADSTRKGAFNATSAVAEEKRKHACKHIKGTTLLRNCKAPIETHCCYCGQKLENGKFCTCEAAQRSYYRKRRKTQVLFSSFLAVLIGLAAVITFLFVSKPVFDLNDYLIIDGVYGQNGQGVASFHLDEDRLLNDILRADGTINPAEAKGILSYIVLIASPEEALSNGDTVVVSAAFVYNSASKLNYRLKNAEKTITVYGLAEQDPPVADPTTETEPQPTEATVPPTIETTAPPSTDTTVIKLTSAEELYALSRILAHTRVKENFLSATTPYVFARDLAVFTYPEDIATASAQIKYLQTADFILLEDVELVLRISEGDNYFTGIGSEHFPFGGNFDGNGHTITLRASDNIVLNEKTTCELGLFAYTNAASITNLHVAVKSDIVVTGSIKGQKLKMGVLAGYACNTQFEQCTVTLTNSTVGANFAADSIASIAHIGGFVGDSLLSTYNNCTVKMTDSSVIARGKNVAFGNMYATFSVGGFMGFSQPGSDNSQHIGRIGNQLRGCKVIASNAKQADVVSAYTETGDELAVGGLIGCSFNNLVVDNCTVEVSNGNISAIKSATTDTGKFGTQVGGIIGRLEHTGTLSNCVVRGSHLNILSESTNTYTHNGTNAGGIVGYSMGAYHRNVAALVSCSFEGNGSSTISAINLDPNGKALSGGIAGYANYKAIGCTVQDVTVINNSNNPYNCASGKLFGWFDTNAGLWTKKEYFAPDKYEITDCGAENVKLKVSGNVSTEEIH